MVTGMLCTRMAFDAHPGAVLFAKMDVSRLVAGVVRDIRSGRTGHAWVIDETGTVLYHPEQGYIGKDAFTEDMERKPCVSVDQTGRVLKDRILRGDEGTGKYVSLGHRGIQGEVRGLIAFAPVRAPALSAGHVWSVAVVAPANEVAETARRMHMRHIWAEIALCAAMVMGGLTAVVYHRRTLRTRKAQATQATVEPKRQA
jgi:two-component system NtrC family sensor kinase